MHRRYPGATIVSIAIAPPIASALSSQRQAVTRTYFVAGLRAGTPFSIPRTLKSSSISGQRMPLPCPMISYRARCAAVASESRQDQFSGMLMMRPSARWAVINSPVTSTELARGSLLGFAAVLMPCLQDEGSIFKDNTSDDSHVVHRHTILLCQRQRG